MKLNEAGWKDQLKRDCLEYMKKKGKDNVTADELMEYFQPIVKGPSNRFRCQFSSAFDPDSVLCTTHYR
jgi:hypothetical protein